MTTGEQAGDFLPSARAAMRYAVELASNPMPAEVDLERARVWVLIAAELRVGSRPPLPFPRPLDRGERPERVTHYGDDYLLPICEQVSGSDPEGCLVSFNLPHVTCFECLRIVKEREVASSELAESDLAPAPVFGTPVERHAAYEAAVRDNLGGAYAGEQASARFERVTVPVPEPQHRASDTAVIRYDDPGDAELPRCGNCGHSVELALEAVPAIWIHALTRQPTCPVSAPDQPHTYAQPAVDSRG